MKQKELIAVIGSGLTTFHNAGHQVSRTLDEMLEIDLSGLGVTSPEQIVRISDLGKLESWGQVEPFTLDTVRTVKDFIWHVMASYARRVTREILATESNPPRAPEQITFNEHWRDIGAPLDPDGLNRFRAKLVEQIEALTGIRAKKFGRPYIQALGAANTRDFLEDITALCRVSSTTFKSGGGGE